MPLFDEEYYLKHVSFNRFFLLNQRVFFVLSLKIKRKLTNAKDNPQTRFMSGPDYF